MTRLEGNVAVRWMTPRRNNLPASLFFGPEVNRKTKQMKELKRITSERLAQARRTRQKGSKSEWAAHWGACIRWVEYQLAKGLPVLRDDTGHVTIVFARADQWMVTRYGTKVIKQGGAT